MMETTYYNLKDLKLVGKQIFDLNEEYIEFFIYENGEWIRDEDDFIMDRLIELNISELEDSSYKIENPYLLESMEVIDVNNFISLIWEYSNLSEIERDQVRNLRELIRKQKEKYK